MTGPDLVRTHEHEKLWGIILDRADGTWQYYVGYMYGLEGTELRVRSHGYGTGHTEDKLLPENWIVH